MPLVDVPLRVGKPALPGDVRAFLREARRRIDRFQFENRVPAFVACDFRSAYATLRALAENGLPPGDLFCEWGSGLGVVACLAAKLGFDVRGIEIEPALVDAAQQLADDFDLFVEFIHGSFIPPGVSLGATGAFSWLTTTAGRAHEELNIEPEEVAVVFAYPWPDEEQAIADLFDHCAGTGAVLVTDHGLEGLRVRQKASED